MCPLAHLVFAQVPILCRLVWEATYSFIVTTTPHLLSTRIIFVVYGSVLHLLLLLYYKVIEKLKSQQSFKERLVIGQMSKKYKNCLPWSFLWVSISLLALHVQTSLFSPVHLSHSNLVLRPAGRPWKGEGSKFSSPLYTLFIPISNVWSFPVFHNKRVVWLWISHH